MSVPQILRALHGNYEPTGFYSFEFRRVSQGALSPSVPGIANLEIFLLLPPESVQVTERPRSELLPTLGGGYLADYGNDFKEIKIDGSSHFFYAGRVGGRRTGGQSAQYIDGFTEFIKLRYIISRYRDYTMTPNSAIVTPFFDASTPSTAALRALVDSQLSATGEGALADVLEMIWHDYDDDNHFKVKVDQFVATRDKKDPWTATFSIGLTAYQVEPLAWRNPFPFRRPTVQNKTAWERIREVTLFIGSTAPETVPDQFPVQVSGGVLPITNFIEPSAGQYPQSVLLPR